MKTLWKDYIPNDYSRCWNKSCPLRNDCLRFLDKGNGTVTISDFKPKNGECEYQIKPTHKIKITE